MKYYSELTKKFYDSADACGEAEIEYNEKMEAKRIEEEQKNAERKEMAKKVEDSRNAYMAAREEYNNNISEFCKKYGYYHTSYDKEDVDKMFSFSFPFSIL